MKTVFKAALAALLLAGAAGAAHAGDIALEHPWSRATPAGAPVAAGYVTLKNSGAAADKLVSATADVAGKVEVHEMAMDNGVMKMRQIPGIEIPAGQTLALKPGSYHVMLLDLKQQVKDGDTVPITLEFVGLDNKKHTMEIKAPARPLGAGAAPGEAHKH